MRKKELANGLTIKDILISLIKWQKINKMDKIKKDLKEYGAEITEIKINDTLMFQVRDNGIWGFAESEPDMILTEDGLEELHETYIE